MLSLRTELFGTGDQVGREWGRRIHSHSWENVSDAFSLLSVVIKVISTLTKGHFIKISFDRLLVIALKNTLKCVISNEGLSDSSTSKLSAQHSACPSRAITLQLNENLDRIRKESQSGAP